MGAWGTGFYSNDSALDWMGEVSFDQDTLKLIEQTLRFTAYFEPEDYMEVDDGMAAVAAAALLTAIDCRSALAPGDPLYKAARFGQGKAEDWIQSVPLESITPAHRTLALKALERVRHPDTSEAYGWWRTDVDRNAWLAGLAQLEAFLQKKTLK